MAYKQCHKHRDSKQEKKNTVIDNAVARKRIITVVVVVIIINSMKASNSSSGMPMAPVPEAALCAGSFLITRTYTFLSSN